MKKILLALLVTSLAACSKQETILPTQESQTVLVRVESVSKTGNVTYSEIVSVKLR